MHEEREPKLRFVREFSEVVPEIALEIMEQAIIQASKEGFFDHLSEIAAGDLVTNCYQWPPAPFVKAGHATTGEPKALRRVPETQGALGDPTAMLYIPVDDCDEHAAPRSGRVGRRTSTARAWWRDGRYIGPLTLPIR